MKNFKNLLLGGAIAASTAAGLASCSSSDDIAEAPVNPSYDGQTVKTQFAINIATPVTQNKTRMTDVNTQNSNNFLGMNDIRLIPLTDNNISVTPGNNGSGSRSDGVAISQVITLSNISNNEISSSNSNKIYNDVNIPVGTKRFLFYGVGPIGNDASGKFKQGSLTATNVANISKTSDIKYSLTPILGSNTMTTEQNAFVAYLNAVAGTTLTVGSTTYKWSECTELSEAGKIANPSLKSLYNNFTSSPNNGRAGSANAIKYMMQDLYNACASISEEKDASNNETDAAKLAKQIMENIKNPNLQVNNAIKFTASDAEPYTLDWDNVANNYKNFPTNYYLPEGSVQLSYTNGTFSYNNDAQVGSGTESQFKAEQVNYPSTLAYFVSTPARATNTEIESWVKTVSNWDNAWQTGGSYNGWDNEVKSTSRSVALQYNINYGVACLKTSVRCTENVTALEDNTNAFNATGNNMITIPNNGFQIKGILIGGQPSTVDWDFINTLNHNAVIYDNIAKANETTEEGSIVAKSSDSYSSPNYTLVFDNYAGNDTEDVYVALEVENNSGQEFYGVDGKVGIGQKFYLVGQLKPTGENSNTTTTITWPDASKSDFPAREIKRVFIQDHITEAKFTIKSLKNAYVTIPDLRATKMQLGLSVDLSWKTGLTFDVPID